IILYEMLTGRVPFEGESTGEILMKHLSQKPDLEKLPPRLRPVIGKALEKDPAQRFGTINALREAFEQAAIGKYKPTAAPVARLASAPAPAGGAARPRAGHQHYATTMEHAAAAKSSPWHPTRRA